MDYETRMEMLGALDLRDRLETLRDEFLREADAWGRRPKFSAFDYIEERLGVPLTPRQRYIVVQNVLGLTLPEYEGRPLVEVLERVRSIGRSITDAAERALADVGKERAAYLASMDGGEHYSADEGY